jgi:transposase
VASSPLEQVRETAQALVAEGQLDEAFDFFVSALDAVLRQNRDLELLVAKLRRERVGKRSERMDPAQLSLLFEQLAELGGQEEVDLEAETREDAELDQEIKDAEEGQRKPLKKARKPKGNWRISGAERQVHHVEVPEEERTCVKCGREKQRIGEDTTSLLEFVPGHFVEHEYHKAKYACGTCKQGVTTAPGPSKLIERSAADASVLAHVVVSKYADHCPLHRLHRIYERSGVTIPVSTMSDWTGEVGVRTEPLVDRLAERVRQAYVIRTDATGLKVLDPSSSENIERGTMWCYVGDDLDVVFRYTPTGEGASGPWEFLAGRTGYVQADAASVFDRLFDGQVASAIEAGCWSHGRRRLVALRDTDCRVAYPLKLIARLYRIEHLADARQLSPDERASLRQERSQPVLAKLKRWLLSTLANEPPSSDLAKATGYLLNQWTALSQFIKDGRLDLDNNLCEQQMRDIALGRKNYLFAGSHDAARRAAALYSLMRSCAQRRVPPLPYLTDVLRKLADGWKQSRLDELLPHRWEEMHGHSSSK